MLKIKPDYLIEKAKEKKVPATKDFMIGYEAAYQDIYKEMELFVSDPNIGDYIGACILANLVPQDNLYDEDFFTYIEKK